MKRVFTYLIIGLFLWANAQIMGQDRSVHELDGRPFNTHRFIDQADRVSNENWATIQHPNGLLYVANQNGVLEFDGHTWRLIELPGKNSVFSLAIGTQESIYVGARGDFGMLVPDQNGVLEFESMLDYVKEEERDFLNIWGVHTVSEGVIFQSNKYLFLWDGTRIESFTSDQRLHTSFSLFNRFFVKKDGVGLLELKGDSLQAVSGGEVFADKRVFMMEPLHDGSIMVGAQEGIEGPLLLFKLSESGLSSLPADPHFTDRGYTYTYYSGTTLRKDFLAIASLYDGVFIVDTNGQLIETFGADRSIPDDVTSVFEDRQGGLWITHYTNGITHVGAPFSLSEYDLPGNLVNDIARFEGKLHIATDEGLFTLNDRREIDIDNPATRFDSVDVEKVTRMRLSLLPIGKQLLVATQTGVYSIQDGTSTRVAFDYMDKPRSLIASQKFPGRVYVGMETGLAVMIQKRDGWEWKKLDSVGQPITSLTEAADGTLWFSRKAARSEVWNLVLEENGVRGKESFVVDDSEFNTGELEVELIGGEIGITAVGKGIFRVKKDKEEQYATYLDPVLNSPDASPDSLIYAFSVDEKNFWTVYPNKLVLNTIEENGEVTRVDPQILQFSNLSRVDHVYVDTDQVIWLGDRDRLLKFKPQYAHLDENDYMVNPMIRSLSLAWVDSVLYAGNLTGTTSKGALHKGIRLNHQENDLEFEFALPDFYRLGAVEYSYKVEGVESNWSEWTPENRVVYRNIDPGKHELLVRARSGDTYYETEAKLPFSVLPPWYATWWMKVVYGCFSITGLMFVLRYVNTNKRLELLEQEREWYDRIRRANEQLRTANMSLEEANRLKDEFLANASHELRTPLTAILGFTSVLKEELLDEHQEFAGLIDENGKRLLRTINSLLDLAKLRAGTVELEMKPLEINAEVEKVVGLLAQLAKNQSINLLINKSEYQVFALLDEDGFERVLYNLIGNAIKFTPEGSVDISVAADDKHVFVEIRDTGIGIDEAFIPFLFDEFKQEPSTELHSDGSGLGLAISYKLVDMMGGKIDVSSQKGEGSTFTVTFPVGYTEYSGEKDDASYAENPEAPTQSII